MEKEKTKLTPVRLVNTTGKSALVEWLERDGLHRASLPIDKVAEKVDQDLLDAAHPYGVRWGDAPIKPVSGKELQAALYAAGIWTADDLMTRPQLAIGALQALLWLHLGSLVEYAAKQKHSEVK